MRDVGSEVVEDRDDEDREGHEGGPATDAPRGQHHVAGAERVPDGLGDRPAQRRERSSYREQCEDGEGDEQMHRLRDIEHRVR